MRCVRRTEEGRETLEVFVVGSVDGRSALFSRCFGRGDRIAGAGGLGARLGEAGLGGRVAAGGVEGRGDRIRKGALGILERWGLARHHAGRGRRERVVRRGGGVREGILRHYRRRVRLSRGPNQLVSHGRSILRTGLPFP